MNPKTDLGFKLPACVAIRSGAMPLTQGENFEGPLAEGQRQATVTPSRSSQRRSFKFRVNRDRDHHHDLRESNFNDGAVMDPASDWQLAS